MRSLQYNKNKKIFLGIAILSSLLISSCNKEEDSNEHLQKGADYIKSGDYEKAKLEIKSASQSGKETAETYYQMALLNEKNRQFTEMKENLAKTVELAPTFTQARLQLGKVQLLLGEDDLAMQQADYVLKEAPKNIEALSLRASALIRQKKEPEALAIIENILKENPTNTDALSLKAVIYMQKNDFTQALALIDTAKKADVNNINLDFFTIQLHAKANNLEAITLDYEKLIKAHPENKEFKVTLAKLYVQNGKAKEAESLLRGLIEDEPNNVKQKLLFMEFLSATSRDRVRDQFKQFVEGHKDQSRILLALAEWMVNRRNFEDAKLALERVVELEDDSAVGNAGKTLLAKIAFDNKDFATAKKLVDEILDANSSYDDANVLQARLLLVNEQYDEAIAQLNKVLFSKEGAEEANLLLAQTYLIKGDQKLADKHFLSALEANPTSQQALSYLYSKALQKNEIKSAKNMVEKALEYMPDNIVFLEKLANINFLEKDWDAAKITTQKIAQSPNPLADNVAKYMLAQIHQGQGSYAKAIEFYKELLVKYPENSNALGNMARCYEKINKRNEMISYLEAIMTKKPENISAGILLGDLYLMDKKIEKGDLLLTNMIKNNVKIPQLYILLANFKLAVNDKNKAIETYQKGLLENPENVKLTLSLAGLHEDLGEYDSAVSLYESLIKKNPNLDLAINNLGVLLSEKYTSTEKLNQAVQITERFKGDVQPYYKDTHAWALVKVGRYNDAVNLLKEVVAAIPDVPVFRYHLGTAYYQSGNSSSAINEIKQAIELSEKGSSFPEKKQAEQLLEEIISKTRGH